jgi:hypothetical protein
MNQTERSALAKWLEMAGDKLSANLETRKPDTGDTVAAVLYALGAVVVLGDDQVEEFARKAVATSLNLVAATFSKEVQ